MEYILQLLADLLNARQLDDKPAKPLARTLVLVVIIASVVIAILTAIALTF